MLRNTSNQSSRAGPPTAAARTAGATPSDFIIDKIYEGGRAGHAGDDPLSKLLGVSNSGGFRYLGRPDDLKLVVITSNFNEPDWPDQIDLEAGLLTYFGDRREPGELHETNRLGNEVLRQIFHHLHSQPPSRNKIPPILLFRNTGNYRDVIFLGLVVPGAAHLPATSDLVAVWKSSRRGRFQNYKAQFTILRTSSVPLAWISDVRAGNPLSPSCPPEWRTWFENGRYIPLKCEPTVHTRSKAQQLPKTSGDTAILRSIFQRYQNDSHGFEHFAAKLAEHFAESATSLSSQTRMMNVVLKGRMNPVESDSIFRSFLPTATKSEWRPLP